jgi:hypothetical protein
VTDIQDVREVMRTHIEEPAARRLLALVHEGVLHDSDVKLFTVSVQRYKAAILADYDSFDPLVRDQLRRSLLSDYQQSVERLIGEICGRAGTCRPGADPGTEGRPTNDRPEREHSDRRIPPIADGTPPSILTGHPPDAGPQGPPLLLRLLRLVQSLRRQAWR